MAATPPNVNVGGLMDPEREEHTVEIDPYWDALYDVEKGVEFLRKAAVNVPDFEKARNPRDLVGRCRLTPD